MSNEMFLVLGGAFFFVWVLSLWVFNIPRLFDELSGRRLKKQMKIIKAETVEEVRDTSEELRVLQQESLLDEELSKFSTGNLEKEEVKEEIKVYESSTEELDKTSLIPSAEEIASTEFLDANEVSEMKVKVIHELSNVE